jgi:hypothetical protein
MITTLKNGVGCLRSGLRSGLLPVKAYPYQMTDGNTIGYYDYRDMSKLTILSSGLVSAFNDKLRGNYNLTNTTAQPTWSDDGIVFSNNVLYFILSQNQPLTIHVVASPTSWANGVSLFTGGTAASSGCCLYQSSSTPKHYIYSGTSQIITNPVFDKWYVWSIVYNGASSKYMSSLFSNTITAIASPGTNGNTRFCIGGGSASGRAQCRFKDVIYRAGADDNDTLRTIHEFLRNKYSI